ncbi:MAG: S8 family serine peptidase [Candidatus Aminicenantes bacterium]|nr:S8 family serine peptidase [Candidatus Aminicenantes bacterium]
MKYVKKSMLFLAVLLLLLPAGVLPAEESGAVAGAQPQQVKLLGGLDRLIEFYRDYDRLNDENWTKFQHQFRLQAVTKYVPELAGKIPMPPLHKPKRIRKNLPKELANRATFPRTPLPMYRAFFDPEQQKRMGWSEDTFECVVSLGDDGAALKQAGVKIVSLLPYKKGSMARVQVAGKDLEKVSQLQGVRSMAPARQHELDNDLGSRSTGVPRLRLGQPGHYTRGYTGNGVIVGLIDSGIDWTHPDFLDPVTGQTRIQYIWETGRNTTYAQTPEGMFGGNMTGLNYGTVWTRADITGGTCLQQDTNGHGTHTSGTAAGNGYATGLYTGMAPNADIIMVNGLTNNGILFIYELGRILNRPCVVNMSYGPSLPLHYAAYYPEWYPMDPTDSDGMWIDSLHQYFGPGNIPVKSAGNQGHWNTYTDLSGGSYPYKEGGYHSGATTAGASSHVLNVPDYTPLWTSWWGVPPGQYDNPEIWMGCWMDRPCDITVLSPEGYNLSFPFSSGGGGYVFPDGQYVFITINTTPYANGAYVAWVWMVPYYGHYYGSPYAMQPTAGDWTFTATPLTPGAGHVDFWEADFNLWYGGDYAPIDWATDEIYTTFSGSSSHSNYIVDEGATPYEITVGAWTTRDGWDSIDGHSYTWTASPWMNTIADFSSPGPSRDRFLKPDLAAPGNIILSSLSQYSPYASIPPYITPDGQHMAMSGTSMSAPHVTGGTALILQKNSNLGVADVRGRLQKWARNDAYTRQIGRSGFGAGKLNLLPLNDPPVALLSGTPAEIVLDESQDAAFSGAGSYDPEGFPLTYAFSLVSAPAGAVAELSPSGSQAALEVDPDVEGTYQVGLVVNDGIVDSAMALATVTAKFYPVLPATAFAVQRLESDLIFSKEYVNRLSWQANPENKVTVAGYKLYRKAKGADDGAYQLLQQFAPTVFSYEERGLTAAQLYTYKLTTIDSRGRESDPVVAGN